MRVAVPSPSFCEHPALCAELLALFPDARLNTSLRRMEGEELVTFLQDYDVAVVGLEHMTATVIDALPALKIVSKLGTGVDMIDGAALARRNIRFGWKAGANALSIAELVVGFSILSLRHAGALHAAMRAGEAPRHLMGRLLSRRVFGLHGCGHIGQSVVRLLAPFQCTILACDIADRSAFFAEHGVEGVPFDELVARSEVLSIHVPLGTSTVGMYDDAVLARLRPDNVLINTARGELVDEGALYDRLQAYPQSAACADVFQSEPAFASKLLSCPNFFGTPHIGGSAQEARLAMGRIAIEGIFENDVPVPGRHPFA